jgi:hypothetical protein
MTFQQPPKKSWHQYKKVAPKGARTSANGIVFHSKTEKDRYEHLRLLQMAKEISGLETQVRFDLKSFGEHPFIVMAGIKCAHYTCDFFYIEHGATPDEDRVIIEDTKGYMDENSKLRIRVFEAFYGHKVRIVKKVKGKGWVIN